MSNYAIPPKVTDSCMVCYEIYTTKKNIFIPKTCIHPLCKGCAKKCKECPVCRLKYVNKKELSEIQKKMKHIYFLRKSMFQFMQGVNDIQTKMDHTCDNHYGLIYNTMVTTIVMLETEMQGKMNAKDRKDRREKLARHPYDADDLTRRLINDGLMVLGVGR